MKFIVSTFLLLSTLAQAGSLREVVVTGEKTADLRFDASEIVSLPSMRINDNAIELVFGGVQIDDSARDKLNLTAPHPLIQRVGVYSAEKGTAKARVVVNGSLENLKSRVKLTREKNGVKLEVAYPATESAALNLLKEEQQPLKNGFGTSKVSEASSGRAQTVFVIIALAVIGATAFFVLRFLKKQGKLRGGSRKFLVEQLSYTAVGPKAGVALLKVGGEFILVGVTGQQVTMLSDLPKLQKQYDEESNFERGVFKEAVEEEFKRVKRSSGINA